MHTGFFLMSKLVWLLLSPATLLMAGVPLLALWWLARGKVRATAKLLGAYVALMLMIGIFPLGALLLHPLESRFPARPPVDHVAGIILLGGGVDPLMSQRSSMPKLIAGADRYTEGLALARRFPDAPVLFTGGSAALIGPRYTEARAVAGLLTELGLPPARLHLEDRSRTTAENAVLLKAMWPVQAPGRWLLVTTASHMPRAMGAFCRAGWHDLVAWPVDYHAVRFADGIGWDPLRHLLDLDLGLKEWAGMIGYTMSGRSTALLPESC